MPLARVRAKKIRIGNASYLGTRPFKLLAELDFVEYQEGTPPEIARRLNENEIDVGLISASDFAIHGGYVGLDHGLACAERSNALLLCARQKLSRIDTVYIYDGASASSVLLRLLLKEEWRISPRFLRVGQDFSPSLLRDNEAMLVLNDEVSSEVLQMPFVEDLVAAWDRLTGKPFVFLLWAVRPGVLSLKQHQALHEMFHRCVAAAPNLIESDTSDFGVSKDAATKFRSRDYAYYLDDNSLAGLNSFYDKAARLRLLPKAVYQSATYTLLNRKASRAPKERGVSESLELLLDGSRLGMREAVRLAEQASLADLGMAADLARAKLFPERTISQLCILEGLDVQQTAALHAEIERGIAKGARQLMLIPRERDLTDIGFFENLLYTLRSSFSVEIEAFTVPQLLLLAKNTGASIQHVLSRLITAGLSSVSGMGGGMLIDRILRKRQAGFTAAEWLDAMKWIHRFGARSSCCMTLSPRDNWEDRLIHLHKIRNLQDENPGFSYFYLDVSPEWDEERPSAELLMRTFMIVRLFLDNVVSIQEKDFNPEELPGVLSMCFGANEVRVDLSDGRRDRSRILQALQNLRDLGMDFTDRISFDSGTEEVH